MAVRVFPWEPNSGAGKTVTGRDGTLKLVDRFKERVRDWDVVVEETRQTESSLIGFGRRGNQSVVLKVLRHPGDEWRCGEVLDSFKGKGVVRVYEHVDGAVLLERLTPGTSLAGMALNGRDEEATEILAEVIQQLSHPRESLSTFVTVQHWGKGFQRYLMSGDKQIPMDLVEQGERMYAELCGSQQDPRLLHGDLQHYNVLFDADRGWVAIDPKGVVGEIEYELGASLRNPYEKPGLFASPETVEKRLLRYEAKLKLNPDRALAWGFAQAVLSAIWQFEDGFAVDARNPSIMLAHAIRPMLG